MGVREEVSTMRWDPVKARLCESVDSQSKKSSVRSFNHNVRKEEEHGLERAVRITYGAMDTFPQHMRWHVALALGSLYSRNVMFTEARHWMAAACKMQPRASTVWIERARIEEEGGNLEMCLSLILEGLHHCPFHETLLIRALKLYETLGRRDEARDLLSRLREAPLSAVWKVLLEGALMEERAGLHREARRVFAFLMARQGWCGLVYFEAQKAYRKSGEHATALSIVETGLAAIPSYGPLWFAAFHLYEKMGLTARLPNAFDQAVRYVSKELVWKIYLERAQAAARLNCFDEARASYRHCFEHCRTNVRWKLWVAGSRMELRAGRVDIAKHLLERALQVSPSKMQVAVRLEYLRLEEFFGNIEKAREILRSAQKTGKHDWKLYLEFIMLEIRNRNFPAALKIAEEAVKCHRNVGRLWACLIQLKGLVCPKEQKETFVLALQQVAKSGEVWCEGARMVMNPFSEDFSTEKALKYSSFGIQFTPQYGDSFIESMRAHLLQTGGEHPCKPLLRSCANSKPYYGLMWLLNKRADLDDASEIMEHAHTFMKQHLFDCRYVYQKALVAESSPGLEQNSTGSRIDQNSSEMMRNYVEFNRNYVCSMYPETAALDYREKFRSLFGSSIYSIG